jgi:hypothetical protein
MKAWQCLRCDAGKGAVVHTITVPVARSNWVYA